MPRKNFCFVAVFDGISGYPNTPGCSVQVPAVWDGNYAVAVHLYMGGRFFPKDPKKNSIACRLESCGEGFAARYNVSIENQSRWPNKMHTSSNVVYFPSSTDQTSVTPDKPRQQSYQPLEIDVQAETLDVEDPKADQSPHGIWINDLLSMSDLNKGCSNGLVVNDRLVLKVSLTIFQGLVQSPPMPPIHYEQNRRPASLYDDFSRLLFCSDTSDLTFYLSSCPSSPKPICNLTPTDSATGNVSKESGGWAANEDESEAKVNTTTNCHGGINISEHDGDSKECGAMPDMPLGGAHILKAHSLILSTRSPVFRAMLLGESSNREQLTRQVFIDDVDAVVFKELLRFMYTDEIVVPSTSGMPAGESQQADKPESVDSKEENSDERTCADTHDFYVALLQAASKYAVTGLEALCWERLAENLSTNTVASVYVLADAFRNPNLGTFCLQYIVKNAAKCITRPNFFQDLGFGLTQEVLRAVAGAASMETACMNSEECSVGSNEHSSSSVGGGSSFVGAGLLSSRSPDRVLIGGGDHGGHTATWNSASGTVESGFGTRSSPTVRSPTGRLSRIGWP